MNRLCAFALFLTITSCQPANLDSFIYQAKKAPADGYHLSTEIIPSFEEMTVKTSDGEDIFGIWVPGAGPRNDITLIYCRGQGGNIGDSWPRLEVLYPTGYNLFVVDYRGFGRSTGTPSEEGIRIDMRAVRAEIIANKGVDPAKLVYYGRSLGGAVAIDLASVEAPTVLIEESTFTSIQALVADGVNADLPVSAVSTTHWDNLAKIPGIRSPFLAIHGDADDYVPPKNSQQLYDAHPGPKKLVWVAGATHSDVPFVFGKENYKQLIVDFVGQTIE
jgi:fermentation-respiration switch protein FrsA (DUF1100 family)